MNFGISLIVTDFEDENAVVSCIIAHFTTSICISFCPSFRTKFFSKLLGNIWKSFVKYLLKT